MTKTIVIFRKWPDGTIDAYFPFEEATGDGRITCYSRIGQHSSADYGSCISRTKPAKPHEYKALKQELESISYDLDIRSRKSRGAS